MTTTLLETPFLKVAVQAAYPSVRAGLRAMLAAAPGLELTFGLEEQADVTVADLEEGATEEEWPSGVGAACRLGG